MNSTNIEYLQNKFETTCPREVVDFVMSTANDGAAYQNNLSKLDSIKLVPRIFRASEINYRWTLGDITYDLPFIISPMAYQKLLHPDGEQAVYDAAEAINIPFILSIFSTTSFDSLRFQRLKPWLQLFLIKDSNVITNLIKMANSYCSAIVITVDVAIYGNRPREHRNPITFSDSIQPQLLQSAGFNTKSISGSDLPSYIASQLRSDISWDDIENIRSQTKLPLILKGILSTIDTEISSRHSIEGIIVSNHGGRQIDCVPSPIEVFSDVKKSFNKNHVFFDSGIRNANDIHKVLALGAQAGCIARPILWALGCNGREGVMNFVNQLKDDFIRIAKLLGVTNFTDSTNIKILRQ